MKKTLLVVAVLLCSQLGWADSVFQTVGRKAPLVFLPTDYAKRTEWPLLVLLHGYTSTAEQFDKYLHMSERVSSRGFILVVPQGTADVKGDQFWNATDYCCDFYHARVDDVAYLTELIKKMQVQYHVDAKRIYAYGHSNGGFMVNRLGCEHPEIFAALVSQAGAAFKDASLCKSHDAVSMLQIHAANDHRIAYDGTDRYPGAVETIQQWVTRDGCKSDSRVGAPLDLARAIPGIDTKTQYWDDCANGTLVALWTIKAYDDEGYYPHVPRFTPDAMDRVLDFLLARHK